MNINELPPELLIHVLSFVPQWELVSCLQHVSYYFKEISISPELWTKINYNYKIEINHLYQVQNYVEDLEISTKRLAQVCQCNSKIAFNSVTKLRVCGYVNDTMLNIITSGKFVEIFSNVKSLTLCPIFMESSKFDIDAYLTGLKKNEQISLPFEKQGKALSADDALQYLREKLTNLQHLTLFGQLRISDGAIPKVIDTYSKITKLELCVGQNISNEVFTLYTSPFALTNLTIYHYHLNDQALISVLRRSPFLTKLKFKCCPNVTNQGLVNISTYCKLLQDLYFSFNIYSHKHDPCTCNQTLQLISSSCQRLQYFTALNCTHIDYSGVSELVNSCKNLTTIIIRDCGKVTDEMLLSFNNCKMLRELRIVGVIDMSFNTVLTLLRSSKRLVDLSLKQVPYRMTERKFSTDIHISDIVSSESFHSHVLSLAVHCIRDVTKENILRLAELCTDVRHLEFHGRSADELRKLKLFGTILSGINEAVVSDLFHKCVFLPRFDLYYKTFKRSDFVKDST